MNQAGRVQRHSILLLTCVLYYLGTGGCDRSPTDPEPPDPTDYIAYFADVNSDNWVFGYHILSGQLDSFQVPALPTPRTPSLGVPEPRMVVSPGGESIYLALEDSVLAVEIANPQQVEVLPYAAEFGVSVSPNGQYLAVLNREGLNILSTDGYSLLFHDTDRVLFGGFSADSRVFLASHWPDYAYRLQIEGGFNVQRRVCTPWRLGQVIPSPDDSQWYLLTAHAECDAAVEVYDVNADSVIHRSVFAGYGEIELLPNGRYIPYTHPGELVGVCGGGGSSFSVYDITT
ncbi:MAG: hypothetical protein OEV80_05985, partial [candidate division Zixibacteria bacterium]|nr:hypothetical protein [candidate division Zixibacteria bacterium]